MKAVLEQPMAKDIPAAARALFRLPAQPSQPEVDGGGAERAVHAGALGRGPTGLSATAATRVTRCAGTGILARLNEKTNIYPKSLRRIGNPTEAPTIESRPQREVAKEARTALPDLA